MCMEEIYDLVYKNTIMSNLVCLIYSFPAFSV